MKAQTVILTLSFTLGIWACGVSGEHPEHPTPASSPAPISKEHPEQPSSKEHPTKAAQTQALPNDKLFQDDFEKVVKDYVTSEGEKTQGLYIFHDSVTNKDLKLELVKVHKTKICMLEEGRICFACADFKEVGKNNKFDLDFYASRSPEGVITMGEVVIHKVNGKPRFTYDSNNKKVPIK